MCVVCVLLDLLFTWIQGLPRTHGSGVVDTLSHLRLQGSGVQGSNDPYWCFLGLTPLAHPGTHPPKMHLHSRHWSLGQEPNGSFWRPQTGGLAASIEPSRDEIPVGSWWEDESIRSLKESESFATFLRSRNQLRVDVFWRTPAPSCVLEDDFKSNSMPIFLNPCNNFDCLSRGSKFTMQHPAAVRCFSHSSHSRRWWCQTNCLISRVAKPGSSFQAEKESTASTAFGIPTVLDTRSFRSPTGPKDRLKLVKHG